MVATLRGGLLRRIGRTTHPGRRLYLSSTKPRRRFAATAGSPPSLGRTPSTAAGFDFGVVGPTSATLNAHGTYSHHAGRGELRPCLRERSGRGRERRGCLARGRAGRKGVPERPHAEVRRR